jgi:hypothetical protein
MEKRKETAKEMAKETMKNQSRLNYATRDCAAAGLLDGFAYIECAVEICLKFCGLGRLVKI